jgi:hypothetical protein
MSILTMLNQGAHNLKVFDRVNLLHALQSPVFVFLCEHGGEGCNQGVVYLMQMTTSMDVM